MTVKVRFAPSPTGPLHIGGARSALFNYLFARHHGGVFIVRSEDTDLERSSRESERNILDALRWLNIEWQEGIEVGGENGPYRQTERLDIYREYVNRLLEQGDAYYCYCSEEELEAERQMLLAKGELPRYLGKCRSLTEEQRKAYEAEGRKPVIRFKVPQGQQIVIQDRVRGEVVFESDGIGDFVIVKSDGIPTYNFAVVIDDTTMSVTHVIRGEEHLSNTPRQVLLYQALKLPVPEFAHISLILNTEGRKMSKRDGDTAVIDYKAKGYLPEAVTNFIALLGWAPPGNEEFYTLDELAKVFTLDRVSKSPAVFDLNKLNHINAHYIKKASSERLGEIVLPYLQEEGLFAGKTNVQDLSDSEREWLYHFIDAVKEKVSSLIEVKAFLPQVCGVTLPEIDEEALAVLKQEQVPEVLKTFRTKLESDQALTREAAKDYLKQVTKELKLSGKLVFMPVRIALTGQMHGPDLDSIIYLLGKENAMQRLEQAFKAISN